MRDLFRSFFAIGLAVASLAAADLNRGIGLYRDGNYKDAAAELRSVASAEPENLRARYYLGLSVLQLGQYKEAESELIAADKMISKEKSDPEPREDQVKVGLARVSIQLKNYTRAGELLDQAQALRSDNPEVHFYSGRLDLERRDYAGAARHLEKAIHLEPGNAYAHYYAGIAYSNLKRPDKMVEQFEMFLKLAPNAPESKKVQSLLKGIR